MIKVYVASPFTKGDQGANVRRQLVAAEQLYNKGYNVYAPLVFSYLQHLHFPRPYEGWMQVDFDWILSCDGLLRLSGASPGADREVDLAKKNDIPVFTSLASLDNWFKKKKPVLKLVNRRKRVQDFCINVIETTDILIARNQGSLDSHTRLMNVKKEAIEVMESIQKLYDIDRTLEEKQRLKAFDNLSLEDKIVRLAKIVGDKETLSFLAVHADDYVDLGYQIIKKYTKEISGFDEKDI